MTHVNPYLFLTRLIVTTHLGGIAYDEIFHSGVNIIRGKNSSGKSTISNFIFFVLGGDYTNWNAESLRCHEVFAQVEINGAIYTLKREIKQTARQAMSIFWGTYEDARKNNGDWKTFSYSQSEDRLSFSNILFNALSFPEVRNEQESNITMNQVLRLLYIDQDSPTQKLFRYENFDHPLIRQAISELLLGVYDDSLYNDRINLKKKIKEQDEKTKTLDNLTKAFAKSGSATSTELLEEQILSVQNEIESTSKQINDTKAVADIRIATNSDLRIEELQKQVIPLKYELTETSNEIHQLDLDILDSKQFIEMLSQRVVELNKSIAVRKSLGQLTLEFCPECLTPLDKHVEEGSCFLCKHDLPPDELRTHAKRLKQELELQIKESKMLLQRKEETLQRLKAKMPEIKQHLIISQRELNRALASSQSSRDDRIDALLLKKGGLEKQVEILTGQIEGLSHLASLKDELIKIAAEIKTLQLNIQAKESVQNRNIDAAMLEIEKFAVYILHNDLERQSEFKNARNIKIDFYDDSVSLDGNFNFSASSNTYLKNAARFAIFFASLKLQFMRYPRFILCDNMEDKGMEKERTQNFQDLIVTMSETYKNTPHQIIFSTSMIADDLDGTFYCVGGYYDNNNKTLNV